MPAYNEKGALHDALDQAVAELERFGTLLEIIVVDDGSDDGTPALLGELAAADPRIRVVRHPGNLGKGRALLTGLAAASHEWILFIDADLQIPLLEFGPFEAASAEADVIIGYRRDKRYTLHRRVLSLLYRGIVRILFGLRVRDVGCPFKLFKGDHLRDIQFSTNGFGIDVELLWRLSHTGARVRELPVESLPRRTGVSKVTLRGLAGCVWELAQLRIRGAL
jgi:dolichol-phosphate mannosyltransferase